MLKLIYRGKEVLTIVILLVVAEAVSSGIFGFVYADVNAGPQYALLGYILPSGVFLLGAIFALLLNTTVPADAKAIEWSTERTKWAAQSGMAVLTYLTVVLVALAGLADNPAASSSPRLWGWVPLCVFCLLTTLMVSGYHEDLELAAGGAKSRWYLRWAFALSFLIVPLHFHFWFPAAIIWPALALHLVLLGIMLFDWRIESRSVEKDSPIQTPPASPDPPLSDDEAFGPVLVVAETPEAPASAEAPATNVVSMEPPQAAAA
ncbi:MAG: hypothetical protein V4474_04360 [Patescibacteria group bacterium]